VSSLERRLVRASLARCALALSLLAGGCMAPTLSKPRGAQHLDALAQAEAHQHHGRLADAADAYLRAAESAERRVDRDEALYRRSRVLARMGDYPRAIAVCDELGAQEEIARRTLRARLDAARYRLRGDDPSEHARAERDLRALVVTQPESAAARSALRLLAQKHVDGQEDDQEALAWTRQLHAEVAQSSLGEALMSVEAELLRTSGRRAEAIAVLEQQVARYPYPQGRRWDDSLWLLADMAMEDGRPRDAIGYLQKMIAVHEESLIIGSYTRPTMPKAALRIARIYRDDLADVDAALDAYAEARSEFPRSLVVDDALAEEAELRMAQGQRDRGCALLRELVEAHEVGSARRRAETRIATECH